MTGSMAWAGYIYLSEQTMMVYLGTVFDVGMALLHAALIFKYHNRKGMEK